MNDDQLSGRWPAAQLPDAWTWVPFSEFWQDFTDTKKKIPQKEYLTEGRFAVVDQGEALIGGFTNSESLLSTSPLPAIVFGDHTRAVKFIDVPFAQGADGVRVLGVPSGIDPKFAYKALETVELPNKGYSRHFKFLKATAFPLPPLAEQKRIVAKLDSLSAKSARARTELARIDTLVTRYKQAVLTKAFSGELTKAQGDEIRNEVTVGAITAELDQGWSPKCERVPATNDDEWAVITTTSVQPISFDPHENKALPDHLTPRPKLQIRVGDILITRAGPRVRCGICCYVTGTRPNLMVCDKAYRLRLNGNFDPEFFVFLMNSPQLLSEIERLKTGGNDSGLNLTQARFRSLKVPLWSMNTQKCCVLVIKDQFEKIDRLAAEAKRALELVGKLDEAILAKAFRGELVPQDPNDEPASVLLDRIKAERAAAPKVKRGRGKLRQGQSPNG